MIITTVRMVHKTMAAIPMARLMKEKFRASREAISADIISPRARAVLTCGTTKKSYFPVMPFVINFLCIVMPKKATGCLYAMGALTACG